MSLRKKLSSTAKTIYLIEDNQEMRKSIETILTFLKHEVISFTNGRDFLELDEYVSPAVVVTDMRMPRISGVDLQAELIRRGLSIPIIFISGESTISQGLQAMKQGAIEFLLKPFDREDLLEAIERGLTLDANNTKVRLRKTTLEQHFLKLAPREREAFHLLARGFSNSQLKEAMDIALPTAKQYKAEVMRKLKFRSLSELIDFSQELIG